MEENKIVKCYNISGADPGFKLGGVAHLKKLRQKIIFFPIAEVGVNIFGVFRVKNYI
jgi:hypothetical protein